MNLQPDKTLLLASRPASPKVLVQDTVDLYGKVVSFEERLIK